MAYDEPPYRRYETETADTMSTVAQHRFSGQAGFREEPDFRPPPQSYSAGSYGGDSGTSRVSRAELHDVFDDPAAGEPGRDRLAVHWVWELLLLVGVGAVVYLLWRDQPSALRGDELTQLLIAATGFGLLALAAGMTLRTGAPNLAIGPVAAAAGAYFAQRGDEGVAAPTIFALGVAVLLGLAVAALVTIFQVPGWAASLAAAGGAVVWLQMQDAQIPLAGSYDPTGQAAFLFALVAALGILGGLLGTLAPVRRAVGGFRPVGDPARRRGAGAAVLATGTLVASMVFAVIAGVLLTAGAQVPAQGSVGVHWLEWTLIGFGVALVGGTSAFGRRAGVFGTTLAVIGLVVFHRYQQEQGWEIALLATAAVAVAAGLVVTRMVETFGRPRHGEEGDWESSSSAAPVRYTPTTAADPAGAAPGSAWPAAGTDAWTPQPVAGNTDPWQDDRWQR